MLAKVLSAGEDEAGIEVAPVGDDINRTKAALAQRTTGNLAALSGAHGLTYMEVQAGPFTSYSTCNYGLPATCMQGLAICSGKCLQGIGCLLGKSNTDCGDWPHCARSSSACYFQCTNTAVLLLGSYCMPLLAEALPGSPSEIAGVNAFSRLTGLPAAFG